MATFYGSNYSAAKSGTLPQAQPNSVYTSGKERSSIEIFTMAAQASGSLLYLGTLPIGAIFTGIELTTGATLGSATLAAGSAASAAKYKAAAVFTAVDTPTMYGTAAGKAQAPLTAPEDVFLTVAAAALPGAGTLVARLCWKTVA